MVNREIEILHCSRCGKTDRLKMLPQFIGTTEQNTKMVGMVFLCDSCIAEQLQKQQSKIIKPGLVEVKNAN